MFNTPFFSFLQNFFYLFPLCPIHLDLHQRMLSLFILSGVHRRIEGRVCIENVFISNLFSWEDCTKWTCIFWLVHILVETAISEYWPVCDTEIEPTATITLQNSWLFVCFIFIKDQREDKGWTLVRFSGGSRGAASISYLVWTYSTPSLHLSTYPFEIL